MSEEQYLESDADKLRRRNRELTILNTIAQALNHSIDLDQALGTALAQVAELLDLHTGWIWLLHEETGESYLAAAQNLPPALAGNPRRMEGTCYCLDTYRAGDLDGAANINVVTCSRLWGLVDGTDGLRYHASIPLYAQEKRLGVLNVASTDWRELSPEDLRLLYTVGDMLSIAIERARLFAKSVQLGAADERNRLAREIHDTLAQGLSATALHLETADALAETEADSEGVMNSRIRILVADDHPVVRDGLVAMLNTQADFEIVGQAATGPEVIHQVAALQPDLVLLDLEMPEMDDVEVLKRLRQDNQEPWVIIFTAFDTDDRIVSAVQSGAGVSTQGHPARRDLPGDTHRPRRRLFARAHGRLETATTASR